MTVRELQLRLRQQLQPAPPPRPLAPPSAVDDGLSPRVRQLRDYWLAKRGDRAMPARRDIDPAELKPLLPQLIIADLLHEPLRVRYRLAGTRICDTFGFNIAGRWLHELDVTSDVAFWTAQYARMVATRAPVHGRTTGSQRTVEVFRADWALFPLSSDGVSVDQSLEIEDWTRGSPTARYEDTSLDWQVVAFD
jgi:hypothetical protein